MQFAKIGDVTKEAGTESEGLKESIPRSKGAKKGRYVRLMALTMVVVGVVDQATKALMLRLLADGPIYLIGDWFRLRLLFNPGAAFSMGENSTWIFTCIQIAFVVGISATMHKIKNPWEALGLALIAGGALGNLIDRLFRDPAFFIGHVVDFISVGNFAVFNVADSAITVGVIVFIIALLREEFVNREEAHA